jgi:hypothetical protein
VAPKIKIMVVEALHFTIDFLALYKEFALNMQTYKEMRGQIEHMP